MRKLNKLWLSLALIIGFSVQLTAQAPMPKISDGTNTYWYYMKNHGDYSKVDPNNPASSGNRAAKVLVKNANGYYYGVEPWNNKTTWAKFKIVAGSGEGKYDIITEDGLYLNEGVNGDVFANNPFKSTDNTDWTFNQVTDSRGVAAFRLKNNSDSRLQLKIQSAGFAIRSEYPSDENNNLWNFIPADVPYFETSDATTSKWYRIKNLEQESNNRVGAYLFVNASNKLAVSQTTPAVWKFEKDNISGKYYIVNEDGKYASRSTLGVVDTKDNNCLFEIYPTFGVKSTKMDVILANDFEGSSPAVMHPYSYDPYEFTTTWTKIDQGSKWMLVSIMDEIKRVVAEAENLFAATSAGDEAGQYPATARSAFQTAINTANQKIVEGLPSNTDLTNIETALADYKAAKIAPYTYSGPSVLNKLYTLKLAQTGAANDGKYLRNPRTGTIGEDDNQVYAVFSETLDETTVWRFKTALTGTDSHLIESARGGHGELLDEVGRVRDLVAYKGGSDDNWFAKTLLQNKLTYDADTKLIVKINQNSEYYITNNEATGDLRKDPSNWSTFTLEEVAVFTGNGNWSDATNWLGGVKPTATANVFIDGTATLNENATVNNLTIKSGATLVPTGTYELTVSSSTTVEQLVNKPQTYYIGSPVSNMTSSANIGNAITFTESNDSWSSVAAFANPTPGKGYGVQVGAKNDPVENVTISFTGALNGNVNIDITSTATPGRRFNFLGNPYPSYLDGADLVAGDNLEKTIWLFFKEGTTYQFKYRNTSAGVGDLDDAYIAPMQGFWVRLKSTAAQGNHSFAFTNAMRKHKGTSGTVFHAPQASEKQVLRLAISNGTVTDEATILFSENANSDWNSSKMMNPGLNIYTVKAGSDLALNSRTAIEYDVETAVGVKAESGVYTFSASKFENFGAEKAYLLDKVANVATDLSSSDYTVNFTEAYQGTDRFALVFPRSGVISGLEDAESTGFFAFANNNRISVNSDAQAGMIYVFNSVGQQVAAEAISGTLTTVSTALPAGVYMVKVNNLTTKVVVR
ncbi:MAG TPA: T9SS type A sorting domain-containing protein [Bacteroidales bacterium]|nr:T9SS type A sorting domain-containing protein [Bacteroidales bacterium]